MVEIIPNPPVAVARREPEPHRPRITIRHSVPEPLDLSLLGGDVIRRVTLHDPHDGTSLPWEG